MFVKGVRLVLKNVMRRNFVYLLVLVLMAIILFIHERQVPTVQVQPIRIPQLHLTEAEKQLLSMDEMDDITVLGRKARLYKRLFEHHAEIQQLDARELSSALRRNEAITHSLVESSQSLYDFEAKMFGWMRPKFKSSKELLSSFKGRGIVMPIGNGHVPLAFATIRMIREIHKCHFPVEIFFRGDDDLSVENRKKLESIPGVKTRDITQVFNDEVLDMGGWAIKPFALLASSFRHAILMDADVIFAQSPSVLLDGLLYATHGALFFHDRSLYSSGDDTLNFCKSYMADDFKTRSVSSLRFFTGNTAHEQESGVVVIDKKRRFTGLMSICLLNSKPIRDKAYEMFYGDKETFWLGFEGVSEDYAWNLRLPGAAGPVVPDEEYNSSKVCSMQLLHVDEYRKPLWFNGGIAQSKYDDNSPLANLTHFTSEPGEWELLDGNQACLRKSDIIPIQGTLKDVLDKSGAIFLQVRDGQQKQ